MAYNYDQTICACPLLVYRKVKDLEKARLERRKSLFESQDQFDARKEELLSSTEARLKQHIESKEVFTIKWRLD